MSDLSPEERLISRMITERETILRKDIEMLRGLVGYLAAKLC